MGNLANLVIPRREVEIGAGPDGEMQTVAVGPLDMTGIVLLVQEDRTVFETIMETDGGLTLSTLLKMAPRFCSKMIAHAAGEPTEWEKVESLPFGVQLKLVAAVWELTNIDMADLGKVAGYLASVLAVTKAEVAAVADEVEESLKGTDGDGSDQETSPGSSSTGSK